MKKKLIAIVFVLAAAGGAWHFMRQEPQGEQGGYSTVAADRGAIEQSVSASGTLNPVKLVNVGSQVSGTVIALHADFNDKVTEGQVLAELDPSLLKAQLEQSKGALTAAEATFKLADANYVRAKTLFEKGYVARAELEQAEQARASAQAQKISAQGQVEHDQINMEYSVIRSPVSGVIVSREIDVGQTVAASFQTPQLFSIAQDLKKMQIDSYLSEADVGNVRENMRVAFTVDAFPGRSYEGKVRQIRLNPTTVQNVVTYDVVIDVDNPDLTLLPGMTAFVTIIAAERKDALRVPNAALNFKSGDAPKDGGSTVHVLKNGEAVPVKVKTGVSSSKFTEILEGDMKEGDAVIVDGTRPKKSGGGGDRPQGAPRGLRM